MSPTRRRLTSFRPVITYPTSPASRVSAAFIVGEKNPTSSASKRVPCAIARSGSRAANAPSTIRTKATTPRYWS